MAHFYHVLSISGIFMATFSAFLMDSDGSCGEIEVVSARTLGPLVPLVIRDFCRGFDCEIQVRDKLFTPSFQGFKGLNYISF